MTRFARIVFLAASLICGAPAQEPPVWPDTYVARLQALALLQTFNADVLASRSATLTLESWCRDHRLADEPAIKAEVVHGAAKPVSDEQRQRLQVGSRKK
jgi:hypothetical protein